MINSDSNLPLDPTTAPRSGETTAEGPDEFDTPLDQRIADSLRRQFPMSTAPAAQLDQLAGLVNPHAKKPVIRRRTLLIATGLAAAAALGWSPQNVTPITPHFTPTPLAQVYQQVVADGFEPYYECHDLERFQSVFAERQKVPLTLATMPAGSRMLGLSYTGGLSRDTTAMLCEVEGKPVMVFVDTLAADQPEIAPRGAEAAGLNVFRTQREGLVFYEVTPWPESRAADFMQRGGSSK
jgi:hypothetical protein